MARADATRNKKPAPCCKTIESAKPGSGRDRPRGSTFGFIAYPSIFELEINRVAGSDATPMNLSGQNTTYTNMSLKNGTADIAFIGVGASAIERRSDRGITAFALDAALAAIADADLSPDDIDGYVGAPSATAAAALRVDGADEVWAQSFVEALGLRRLTWAADLHRGFATDMAVAGAHALHANACRYVLGVRALYNLTDLTPMPSPAIGAQRRLP